MVSVSRRPKVCNWSQLSRLQKRGLGRLRFLGEWNVISSWRIYISLTGRCFQNSSCKYNDCSKSDLGSVLIQLCCSNPGPYPRRWKRRETLVWTDDQSKRHMFALQGWLSHGLVSGIHVNHRSRTFRYEHSYNQYPWTAKNINNNAWQSCAQTYMQLS